MIAYGSDFMHDERICPLPALSAFSVFVLRRRAVRGQLGHRALRHNAAERELSERENRDNA